MYRLQKKYKKHNGSLYAVTYSEKHQLLFTGGADKIVATWDLKKDENTPFSIKTDSAILNLQLLNDDTHLFIGLFNGNFHIIDLVSRQEVKFFPYHKSGVFSSFYLDEKNLLFVGAGDGTLSVWNTNNFELIKNYKISNGKIRAIQSIGERVLIGNSEGQIFSVDLKDVSKATLFSKIDHPIYCMTYLPLKNSLLIGDKNAHLTILNLNFGVQVVSIAAHNWPVYGVVRLNDVEFATCSRDKIVKIWDSNSLEVKQRLCFPTHKGHLNSVNNMVAIPSQNLLVSVGDDKQICVWESFREEISQRNKDHVK